MALDVSGKSDQPKCWHQALPAGIVGTAVALELGILPSATKQRRLAMMHLVSIIGTSLVSLLPHRLTVNLAVLDRTHEFRA